MYWTSVTFQDVVINYGKSSVFLC